MLLYSARFKWPAPAFFLLAFLPSLFVSASDLKEVVPITNRILMLHFDDGSVTYPNSLNVLRLDTKLASTSTSYRLSSSDDPDFGTGIFPLQCGRKSKGTEFVKDPPWAGSSFDPRSKPWASEHWIYLVLDKNFKNGKSYVVHTGKLAKNDSVFSFTFDEKNLRSESIHVNTLGYSSEAPKYGYLYQWMGDLGNLDLTAYLGKKFWVYETNSLNPVLEGTVKKRKSVSNPETSQANDTPLKNFLDAEVYECDFTQVSAEGSYKLVVEGMGSSFPFRIGKDPVWEAYYATMRALYHQRSGIRLAPPYSEQDYIRPVNQNTKLTSDDGTSFAGKLLYSDYPYMDWAEGDGGGTSQTVIRDAATGKPLEVAGWYHDAGDWDAYYTHQRIPILLMLTWEYSPSTFADQELNIPESGNGIPDILDEASWLIKFDYRLRKELLAKGYSDGGVGGARICADVYTSVDGSAEDQLPSWKETRHTVVTKADAFMTYLYSGQAAQFACILKKLGRDASHFPVELLDSIEFSKMSHDTVDLVKEALEAYEWASSPQNQPTSGNHYSASLEVYKAYAAVNMFRLTGDNKYQEDARKTLKDLSTSSRLGEDERWAVYSYLLADNYTADRTLQNSLKQLATAVANAAGADAADKRACRWGGYFDFPMLVGQATTPWVFETMIAYQLTGDRRFYNTVHQTADYFLGSNPLHTTWITGVGPRPASCGFHLDSRYNHQWVVYPGWIPYGPWSMAYDYTPFTFTIDGIAMQGGAGPWNKDWANFSMYPKMDLWPGHERWNGNIHAPLSSENTIHQNSVYAGIVYGFVNGRQYSNQHALQQIHSIMLDSATHFLLAAGDEFQLYASVDNPEATIAALQWKSSDKRIAWVDQEGRVTAVNTGTAEIQCSTLDGSVSASCEVTCSWPEIPVDSIRFSADTIRLTQGQNLTIRVTFFPDSCSNQFLNWSYSQDSIIQISEDGLMQAIKPGQLYLIASSVSLGKKDSCFVIIDKPQDFMIADFDTIVPVTSYPQGNFAQLYTPEGTNNIAFQNPFQGSSNPSAKCLEWNRPQGTWRLLGMVLDTLRPMDLQKFSQFQFKYFGKEIQEFYVQLFMKSGSMVEFQVPVDGADCWQLCAVNLTSADSLKQFNVFVNKNNDQAFTCYFDDFRLAGRKAFPIDNLELTDYSLYMKPGDSAAVGINLSDIPLTWVSTNPEIVKVNQSGIIRALKSGNASIKVIPLFGTAKECVIKVEGDSSVVENKTILDFENYDLDWSSGYGTYAWNSSSVLRKDNPEVASLDSTLKVVSWYRDGTNFGGGFAVVFPPVSTQSFEWISMLVYPSETLTSFRLELLNGDVNVGSFQLADIRLPAGKWSSMTVSLADLGATDKVISKINFMPAVGTAQILNVAIDEVTLGLGAIPATPVQLLSKNNIRVYPQPADRTFTLTYSEPLALVSIINIEGKELRRYKGLGESSLYFSCTDIPDGMYLLRVTGSSGQIAAQPLIIHHLH